MRSPKPKNGIAYRSGVTCDECGYTADRDEIPFRYLPDCIEQYCNDFDCEDCGSKLRPTTVRVDQKAKSITVVQKQGAPP